MLVDFCFLDLFSVLCRRVLFSFFGVGEVSLGFFGFFGGGFLEFSLFWDSGRMRVSIDGFRGCSLRGERLLFI